MTATTFTIDTGADEEGIGTLFITSPSLLIRAAVAGQRPASAKHDVARVYQIFRLGNDMGAYATHIICSEEPDAAHRMLDEIFRTYVNGACNVLACDACVSYVVNGETTKLKWYGMPGGSYTMLVKVHCSVLDDEVEEFLGGLIRTTAGPQYVVVRADTSSFGCTATGFRDEAVKY